MNTRRLPSADRVLVTGARGSAAAGVMRAIGREHATVLAADVDPYAPGLYLVPPDYRLLVPRADDPAFADELLATCRAQGVSIVIPGEAAELAPLAAQAEDFAVAGIRLMVASSDALAVAGDRIAVRERIAGELPSVPTTLLDAGRVPADHPWPARARPRSLAEDAEAVTLAGPQELDAFPTDGRLVLEPVLDGPETWVDVLRIDGRCIATVPRECLRRDAGIAVTTRTRRDDALQSAAADAAAALELEGIATVHVQRDKAGTTFLADVAAGVPDEIALPVAAGVNMPALWLRSVLGRGGVSPVQDFDEIAMARVPREQTVPVSELGVTGRSTGEIAVDIAA